MTKRRKILDFGFEPTESPHHFVVTLDAAGAASLAERFAWDLAADEPTPRPPSVKTWLDAYHWSRIAGVAAAAFNRRLRRARPKPADWRPGGETLLAPHFGKELTLLAWAVEGADPTLIPNMIANWLGLVPEERWWLYTTINATAGHPEHGQDRGWRQAIKIAFADNPTREPAPSSLLVGPMPTSDLPPTAHNGPAPAGRRRGASRRTAAQGTLPLEME